MINPYYELLAYGDPEQREKWRTIYNFFNDIDIFYYPEYSRLFELHGDGIPYLFVYYESPDDLLIYPFLKRTIKEIPEFKKSSEDLSDITSPYGYGGYLRQNSNINIEKFYCIFREFCKGANIVSEFVRFHPLLHNEIYSPKDIEIRLNNETIVIHLFEENDKIWAEMMPRCRYSIRKAIKNNVIIIEDTDFKNLESFYNLYIGTMNKLGASDYYFFSKNWFYKLINLLKGKAALFHGYYQDKIINSAIFLYDKSYISYFLAGSLDDYRHLAGNNLILYEVALWAKKKGMKYLHLGGGYQADDNLFRFKESFSPHKYEYYVGRMIHNKRSYEYLCKSKYQRDYLIQKMDYFPLYRAN